VVVKDRQCLARGVGADEGMLPYLHLGTFAKLATHRYGSGREQQERMLVDVLRATYTDTYPLDEDWARRTAAESYDRHPPDPAARQRQLAAGRATTTPEGGLARITAPTLVIHGGADPLIRPAASRALARAIPGARLVTYPGMGHGLPPGLWSAVLDEISTLVEQHNPPAATPGSQR
jgi:pimeloyl-ACP methyl ester carboxylesterase